MRRAFNGQSNYSQQDDEPQVYALSAEEALDWLDSDQQPEVFQGEDGEYYSLAMMTFTYKGPAWAIERYGVLSTAAKQGSAAWGGVKGAAGVRADKTRRAGGYVADKKTRRAAGYTRFKTKRAVAKARGRTNTAITWWPYI